MKRMKKWICMAMCLLLVLIAGSAQAATLSVSGTATVTAAPDQALVQLGVREIRDDVTQAQAKVNEKINAILDALEKNEEYPIAAKDITTQSYNIYPRYRYNEGEQIPNGYEAVCMLSVVVRDVDRVGKVIDAAFAAGANTIDYIEFRLEDATLVNDQALTKAFEHALHKAQLLAEASGIDLSACELNLDANTDSSGWYARSQNAMYAMADEDAAGDTTVRGGQLSFTATVNLTYSDKK